MGKIRVHQLATLLDVPNKDLVQRLQSLGFAVKTHSSSVDEDDARRALDGKSEPEKRPSKVRTVLRRRSKQTDEDLPLEAELGAEAATPPDVEQATPEDESELDPPAAFEAEARTPEVEEAAPPDEVAPESDMSAEPVEDVVVMVEAETSTPVVDASPQLPVDEQAVTPELQNGEAQVEASSDDKPRPTVRPPRTAPAQVSKVVRVIDADAIKARLAAEGKKFEPRVRPPLGGESMPKVRELQVVQDQFGRGPTMVDVTRERANKKSSGRKGEKEQGLTRRDMLEMRAGARDMWRTPGKKRKTSKRGAKTEITQMAAHKRIIEIQGTISVGDLAKQMAIKAGEVLRKLMTMGMIVNINQTIDYETAAIIASEFEYEIKNVAFEENDLLVGSDDSPDDLTPRAPVVTVMGHVDHGKTSLLDAIRKTRVAASEAGGITQHIGAYTVQLESGQITFLDTPGHEAFTAMRARGAEVTDITVLVVAADDGVMPQTIEAVNHSKTAGVPIVVAINKIDKAGANPERVKQALTEFNLIAEEWGGDTIFIPVSAKEGTGIAQLLEAILLQAEMLDLRANPDKNAHGVIIEAQLDKGRGPVATVLVQEGKLSVGSSVVSGDYFGRVRAMYDEHGEVIREAGPSTPVQVLGLSGVPNAGDVFDVVADEKVAKTIAEHRAQKTREQELAQSAKVSLETFLQRAQEDEALDLNLIVKADVQGSVEAVTNALSRLSNSQVTVSIKHSAVGAITESDVNLASTSSAIIIGFGVRPDTKAMQLAEQQKVDIRLYSIIYEAVDGVRAAMEGRLPTTSVEKYLGRAEIRQTFSVPKVGTVAGCAVVDGKLTRSAKVRLLRDGVVMHDGRLSSLKRFKDDVREVAQGYECGAGFESYNDLKPGDLIEAYEVIEVATKLEASGPPQSSSDVRHRAEA